MAMKTGIASLALATMLALAPAARALADVHVLTFEGLGDEDSVGNYYNGGTSSQGFGPGPNYGITFGADSLSLISADSGGNGNFSNAPSGDTVLFFLSGPGDVMDVSAGFTTGFSFYYAANGNVGTGSVSVYSGVDGTGDLLATLTLPGTPNPYTEWDAIGVNFDGTAKSVIFSGAANYIGFDNITLGSATAGAPEPGTWALMFMGVGVAGAALRRRRTLVATAA